MTMTAFAEALHTTIVLASQYLDNKLVIDQTGLKGPWNFAFTYSLRGARGPMGAGDRNITPIHAIEKQLGLELDAVNVPLAVMVVHSADRKPSANLLDVTERLHIEPRPTEFEVATLKRTPPDFRGMRLIMLPGGRINIAGTPVKFLIEQAWGVTDDTLVGAPKWMDTDRYDIVARAAISGAQMYIDDLWPMLRGLLTERFKLITHTEDRPVTAYTLVESNRPKMQKADPGSRIKGREGPAAGRKDPRDKIPARSRLITCQNITMADFADKLRMMAPGYIHNPVLNGTKLSGGYDFTLNFSSVGMPGVGLPPQNQPPVDSAIPTASDPNEAITLFQAIQKQLGLRLKAQKRPAPVLVIDHAERQPTEN